ncbi:MAG: type IX secretion system sortase PorU, partial [Flavisolibacter sp.]
RYFHELDTVNFLSSGKVWFGEEFSNFPGRSLSRSFQLPLTDLLPQQATIVTNVAARSVNVGSRFATSVNGQQIQQVAVLPIGTGTYDLFAQQVEQRDNFIISGNPATVSINYAQGSFNSQGWLNWFEFFSRRGLNLPAGKQLSFRDWNSVGTGNAQFVIANADASTQVWDVTDSLRPVKMNCTLTGNQLRFTNDAQILREYVCFSTTYPVPKSEGRVDNQNLHSSTEKDLLIVTAPGFLTEAQRLAQFHQERDKLRTIVVTTDQVFNEFSSGSPDPTAIRDFAKMYYDRYRSTWGQTGKYLLLFGKGSFDYKNRIVNNTNKLPVYESANSLDPLSTYTSDDYFGFLDDNDDINSTSITNQLDIGVGRIPVNTLDEAKNFVDKVYDYYSADALGPWRVNLNFIADDEDNNLHLQDAETLSSTVFSVAPLFNQQKIYLDAFHQESGSAGGRYPQANAAVNSNIYNGTLLWNYSGHGGATRLAEEVILDQEIVNSWSNRYRLPLFITATCDFAPYDNPTANSLGENLLVRPKTGAIALMTTTRVVFAFSNRIINNNYLKFALQPDANGKYKTLGEALVACKNFTYQASGDIVNNRKFTLLGDPAMRLGFPSYKVRINKVNGKDINLQADTLTATAGAVLDGEVDDNSGTILGNFNGTAYLSLFDKVQTILTLGNDPTSQQAPFPDQESILFKGKASVQNGKFVFHFKVPKDINYQYGNGKISLYAQNGSDDGTGFSNNIIIGGISSTVSTDNQGPEIKAYLNDEKFVNGSITNANPILLLELADSSGINTGSSGIDHDIVATLDNNNNQYYVLNNYYEAALDNFQKGTVHFQLPELPAGHHTLKIKAWDVVNNSSEYVLDFTVVGSEDLRIEHVLNYPNPFTTRTLFWFEHNQPATDLAVKVEIFTVAGKLIKTISQTINTPGNRSNDIEWDGRDEYGQKVGRGVYVYRLRVKTLNGKTASKWERLVILDK